MSAEETVSRAIPTSYKGTQFKSRLEAQCAVLFDKLGWAWEYEKWSIMLPSGVSFTPDFWLPDPWMVVECRGYRSTRGDRQINETASLVERVGGFPLPDNDGNLYLFGVIGPDVAALYFSPSVNEVIYEDGPALSRERYKVDAFVLQRCRCGWRVQWHFGMYCVNCDSHAFASAIVSIGSGKVFCNGVPVEDWQ